MIQVVFSQSEKSVLKSALSRCEHLDGGESLELIRGIFQINIALDIGCIDCSFDDALRKKAFAFLFEVEQRESSKAVAEEVERAWSAYLEEYHTFIKRVQCGEPVRIWYSDAPHSLCGFYATAAMLREWSAPVSAVKLPSHIHEHGKMKPISGWGGMLPSEVMAQLQREERYSKSDLSVLAQCWDTLKRENAPLRAVVNGRLRSVKDDFYDNFIWRALAPQPVQVSQLIIQMMQHGFGMSEAFVLKRLNDMLQAGDLLIAQEHPRFYDSILTISESSNLAQVDWSETR